ncbi:hypothetical protein JNM05_03105 [bacterium]|nr:hypothetical protein [bacterium]
MKTKVILIAFVLSIALHGCEKPTFVDSSADSFNLSKPPGPPPPPPDSEIVTINLSPIYQASIGTFNESFFKYYPNNKTGNFYGERYRSYVYYDITTITNARILSISASITFSNTMYSGSGFATEFRDITTAPFRFEDIDNGVIWYDILLGNNYGSIFIPHAPGGGPTTVAWAGNSAVVQDFQTATNLHKTQFGIGKKSSRENDSNMYTDVTFSNLTVTYKRPVNLQN